MRPSIFSSSNTCKRQPVLNPLRSEAEAFRFLIYVVVVAVLIAGFVLLVRALF